MNGADKDDVHTLALLGAIEEREDVTQRDLAKRLGVALGLANSYLKRCIQTGLVKVQQVPPNRYLYYLTPQGFSEKSRLVARYLSRSFEFYRHSAQACEQALQTCAARGFRRVALCGVSDLAEIAVYKAQGEPLEVVGTLDPDAALKWFMDRPVWRDLGEAQGCDGFLLTEIRQPAERYQWLGEAVGVRRLVVPSVLAPYIGT